MILKKFLQKSIFIKLILVIIVASILIHFISAFFFGVHIRSMSKQAYSKSLNSYIEYILKDLEQDSSLVNAKKIADKNGLQIRYTGKDIKWQTDTDIVSFEEAERKVHPSMKGRRFIERQIEGYEINHTWRKGHITLIATGKEKKFLIVAGDPSYRESHRGLALILVLITIVMFWAYRRIRSILHPLKNLEEGVEALNRGDLEYRVDVNGSDELARLGNSFNSMSGTVKDMIETRKQLLLDVSHELRSPLTRMNVALEFMEESKAKESIREDVRELDTMLGEILESERLSSDHGKLKLESVNVNPMIGEIVDLYVGQSPGVDWEPCSSNPVIEADSDRIRRVIKNIIENAIKYSGNTSEPVQVRCEIKDDRILLNFSDRGEGIAAEELSRIFEPFYRVDRSRSRGTGGYGLGMSICKKIIELHGGTVSVESETGKGTTVKVFLPFSGK